MITRLEGHRLDQSPWRKQSLLDLSMLDSNLFQPKNQARYFLEAWHRILRCRRISRCAVSDSTVIAERASKKVSVERSSRTQRIPKGDAVIAGSSNCWQQKAAKTASEMPVVLYTILNTSTVCKTYWHLTSHSYFKVHFAMNDEKNTQIRIQGLQSLQRHHEKIPLTSV